MSTEQRFGATPPINEGEHRASSVYGDGRLGACWMTCSDPGHVPFKNAAADTSRSRQSSRRWRSVSREHAVMQSEIMASTRLHRISGAGSSRKAAASCRRTASMSRPRRRRKRTWFGSRSTTPGRCSLSLAFGPNSGATATAGPWPSPSLRLLDDGAECDRQADPSHGHAGHPDYGRRARRRDARTAG